MKKRYTLLLSLAVLMAVSLACAVSVDRNPDGSLSLETTLTETLIEETIVNSINDPAVQNVDVTLNDGYVTVTGERQREGSDAVDTYSFQFTLSVVDSQLQATITEGQVNGLPVSGDQLSEFNDRISDGLSQAGEQMENASLQSVSVEPDGIKMKWRLTGDN